MQDLFTYGPKNIREFFRTNLTAILYTIIIHLLVAIILVFLKIDRLKDDRELGVMVDLTEEVSLEDLLEQEQIEVPAEWIEKIYEARQEASNRAVNVNDEALKDISTEDYVNSLLDELESEKDEDFRQNREKLKEIISSKVYEEEAKPEPDEREEHFTGPTTITYEFLDQPKQRMKRTLTIPVYRCEGSGRVIVEVVVRQDGTVSNANVLSAETINDPSCFIEAAEKAALSSSFKSDFSAPEKHRARITYQFIAQ